MSREISRRSMLTVGAAAAATAAATSAVGGAAAASAAEATAAAPGGQPPWRPTPASKPRFRYWWPGADVTPGQVTAEVNAIADAGFGGIAPGPSRAREGAGAGRSWRG